MLLEVVKYGHPVLRKKGARVEAITPDIKKLIADMFETTEAKHGVGLAAQQVGKALQLTNILRDIDEDAAIGRLYLPREALQSAGVTATSPLAVVADARVGAACVFVAERAREHFVRAR